MATSSTFLFCLFFIYISCSTFTSAEDPTVSYKFEISYITASPLGIPQQDQIGSYFYFPSLNFQRASGGFGSFIINPRSVIPIPFGTPAGDITILIGDWYIRNHTALRRALDAGRDLGMPDGNHNLLLAETEGSYTVQQNYTSLDIHVGQTYSFLITMDQNASSDYYIVASARFVNESIWQRVMGVGVLHYSNSKGKASGAYKLDFPTEPLTGPSRMETSVINGTYRGFMEVILQNNETKMHSYHMDGYAFFVVGMGYGEWTNDSRGTYNKWDGIARTTTQVYPGAWTAVLISLDNVGVWNLRTENLDSWYLGQETYVRIVNPEKNNKTELPIPDNALFCGALSRMQKPQDISSGLRGHGSMVGNRITRKIRKKWRTSAAATGAGGRAVDGASIQARGARGRAARAERTTHSRDEDVSS
ncbi:Cupredoxin [Cynara cardunculus var. scolymus]|uniref:Cupredoxin n=1 Tax=Cynara cardunculus var. scolymus TaxID=59895 RepID=A0A103XJQ3_CYNCS|nr:Cupredoxin [Cynara cardunculus var. scolymus]